MKKKERRKSSVDTENSRTTFLPSDNPIQQPGQDLLGRAALAQSFVRQVLMLDRSEGLVVGILGAWGSGKTSFINLVRRELEHDETTVLDFNPWMFSGTEQLVDHFFIELAAQLKTRPDLSQVGEALEDYGDVLVGWTGWIGIPMKLLGKGLQRRNRKGGVSQRQKKIKDLLRKLDKPILVVLDDIDRLSVLEIKYVFKLVRLTANFPNIIYIVAFDRTRVEDALTEEGMPGQDYLEKILQVAIDLPTTPDHLLRKHILSAIHDALSGIENAGTCDKQRWPDVFMEVIRPLLRNMRDVRRYIATVHWTVSDLKGQVALVDVLALEAVRIFLPGVFMHLHGMLTILTPSHEIPNDAQQSKAEIEPLIKAAGRHHQVVCSMIEHLFPAAKKHIGGLHEEEQGTEWMKEHRVAHDDFLRLYLERVEGDNLQDFQCAERASTLLTAPPALNTYLRSLDRERLQDVIEYLEINEDQFPTEHVIPVMIVFLNLLPDLPERPPGVHEFAPKTAIAPLTYRLLCSLKQPAATEDAVRRILPEVNSLSAKMVIIEQIGYQENVGHKLISKEASTKFEKTWRQEVLSASVDTLVKEPDLLRILYFTKSQSDPSEASLDIDSSPELTLALLRSALSEIVSYPGNHAVRRSPRLAWEALVDLYGSEETLAQRIKDLKQTHPESADELLALADKYLSGWQPGTFDP